MVNTNKYDSVNLYFQDESRFGLMTHIGRCLTSSGIKPIVKYKHCFENTYLYGSFSPIDGDSFIYEIPTVASDVFYEYIKEFSLHRPREVKIIIIDNAGFHSLLDYDIPDNIRLVRIPPYTPELNPCEKIWGYIKQFFKNKFFDSMNDLKAWLDNFIINNLTPDIVRSITHNEVYLTAFKAQSY